MGRSAVPTCTGCGSELDGGAHFCPQCGAASGQACPGCSAAVGPDDRFCAACGRALRSERRADGEARHVTVMFADMASSVAQTHGLHPEEAVQLVNRLLAEMATVVERFGGRVDRYLGDGMLAVFGAPRRHEDDAERAVRAAIAIVGAAGDLDLAVTVGINSGEVFFGAVGGEAHRETTVIGPVVNLAARLQGAAAAGEILVGAATERELEGVAAGQPRGVSVKGIPGPVAALAVTGLREAPRRRRGVGEPATSLVGRERELGRLMELVRAAGRGAPSLTIVSADAGVGKSRLIEELRDQLGDDVQWLAGNCAAYLSQTAYAPFGEILVNRLGAAPAGRARLRKEMLQLEQAGWLAPDTTEDLCGYLEDLFSSGVERAAAAPETVSGDDRRSLTFLAVTEFLLALDRMKPIVLVIEDLHWADDLTVELVGHLSRHLDGSRMTMLVATRPEPDQRWLRALGGTTAGVETVPLGELPAGHRRRLLASLLDADELPGDLAAMVTGRARGNPFYIEEVVRDLRERQVLVRTGTGWVLDAGADGASVPTSVGAVVLSRVDRLDPDVRQLAGIAAVIGRSFRFDQLREVAGRDVDAGVDELIAAGLVAEEGSGRARAAAFHHALAQEAVYGSLLPSRRRELHGRVARVLTEAGAGASVVAFHWERSGDDARAAEALLAAGGEAYEAFMLGTALDLLARAETHGAAVGHWPGRFELLRRRSAALERLDRRAEARKEAFEALAVAEDAPAAAGLRSLIGRTYILDNDMDLAHAIFDEALTGLGPATRSTAARWLEANHDKARGYYFSNRPEEMAVLVERAGPIVEQWGSARERYDHTRLNWMLRAARQRYAPSRELAAVAEELVALATASGNMIDLADATFGLGFTHLWNDQPDLAYPRLVEALEMNERVGNTVYAARAHAYVVLTARRNRDAGEVRRRSDAALPAVRAAGMENYEAYIEGCLAWAAWFEADLDQARRHLTQAVEIAGRVPMEFAWTVAWPAAAVAAATGDLAGARNALLLVETERERPRPADLDAAVKVATAAPTREAIDAVTAAARRHLQM